MKLNYRCLVLDHDDTVVDSSATVHFPAYLETMRTLRPAMVPVTLDGWFLKNFDPGILPYLTDELGFSTEELETEYRIWRSYSSVREPHFYPGMAELLTTYASEGGRIAVVSHSERDIIERDYRSAGGVMPELVFGWEMDEDKRKPSPWPVLETLKEFEAAPEDILVVDDLKPAVVMARSAGVAVAGAGWGHSIPEIVDFMKQNCDHYFPRLADLEKTLFS
jgi:beta-phosphoglucomutase-like phosphatase (HAD superfamily)